MIFITIGSRSFQFDRLLKAVDEAVEAGKITDEIFAQVGSSSYVARNFPTVEFLDHDQFNEKIEACDIVLTHGGTGVIVNSVKMGKRVVAVPRLAKLKEAVDDHQIQLVEAFEKLGMVTGCYDCNQIAEAIAQSKEKDLVPYVSNSQVIIDSIDEMIKTNLNEDRTRILMCSSARKEKGGMNSVIDQLMDHEWGEDYEFSYLATHVSGNPIKKMFFFLRAYHKLGRLIRKNTFDVIHIHMSYKGSFFRKYYVTKRCKKHHKKVIIHLHGSEFKDFYRRGDQKRKSKIVELFSIADATIVLGDDWEKFIHSIAPRANVYVINNAIKIPECEEKQIKDKRTLLFLGALIQRKGVIDLLHAIQRISEEGITNYELLIAGSGEEEASLKQYVKAHELKKQVRFLGWITKDQKPELLEKSDVLVLPSYNEGLPVAILEAMSYGLPILSTDVGSISEAVKDGGNGFLFQPGDVDTMYDKIKTLILDDDMWKEQSIESRRIADEKFSDTAFFERIAQVYCDLMK